MGAAGDDEEPLHLACRAGKAKAPGRVTWPSPEAYGLFRFWCFSETPKSTCPMLGLGRASSSICLLCVLVREILLYSVVRSCCARTVVRICGSWTLLSFEPVRHCRYDLAVMDEVMYGSRRHHLLLGRGITVYSEGLRAPRRLHLISPAFSSSSVHRPICCRVVARASARAGCAASGGLPFHT
jgi:hypothetical protein